MRPLVQSYVFVCFLLSSFVDSLQQSVAVRGRLVCKGEPYADAKIKIYNHNRFLDDKLAEGRSDKDGFFHLEGTGQESTRLNAKYNVYHRCGMSWKICYYKSSWEIPLAYVSQGHVATRTYDVLTIELDALKKSRDCFNK